MAELAIPAMILSTVGGTATSIVGQQVAGQEQARAAAMEAEGYRAQEQALRTAAAQDEARRRDQLTSSLDTILAIRAGRSVGGGSPTETAILNDITEDSLDDIRTSRTNILQRAEQANMQSELSERKRRMAPVMANINSATSLFSGATRVASLTNPRRRGYV